MQVEFRSHFSGKKVRLMGQEIRYLPNSVEISWILTWKQAIPKVPPAHIYNVIYETENNFDLN